MNKMPQKMYPKEYRDCIRSILFSTFKDQRILISFCVSLILLAAGVAANIGIPLVLKETIDRFSTLTETGESISLILLSYGILWLISQVALHLRSLLFHRMEQRLTFVLGLKVLSHLYTLSHSFFLRQKPGTLTNIIRRAQRDVPALILGLLFHIIPTIIEFLCVIFIISLRYPILYSLLMGCTLVLFFTYASFSMKTALENREKANEVDQNADGIVTDWLSNYEAVRVFGKHDLAVQICEQQLKKRELSEVTFMAHFCLSRLGQSLILGFGLISLTYLAGKGVQSKELTIGDFVLFNGYILQFITPISILGQVIQDIKKAIIDIRGVIRILLTQDKIQEAPHPIHLKGHQFHIKFKNVSFCYTDRKILDNLSFTIAPGETVLFVGPTGVGKSTIAKLLLRLYEPTAGSIFINQANIKDLSFQSLYKTVGWVPQESYFLNDTIETNLRFSYPEATLVDIERALDHADLLNFVKLLPEGLKTHVGDRGIKLSGGEKQRLSLARLFLKKPKICIFDEATSFLDRNTELVIQKNIETAIPNMTKIIITHRPFMIEKGNRVITLGKEKTKNGEALQLMSQLEPSISKFINL